jgi:hypothetical protein
MGDFGGEYDVLVKGDVPFVRQKGMTCWAAASAMMHGWRRQQTFTPEEAVKSARGTTVDGVPYVDLLRRGQALPYGEFGNFAYGMDMTCAALRSFTPTQFYNLMATRGSPLMVCVLWKNANVSHFYVVTRMYSYDGDPPTIVVNDSTREEPATELFFADFYEDMSRAAQKSGMDKQILHY